MEILNAIIREVENWPGAGAEIRQTSTHPRVRLTFGETVCTVSCLPDKPGAAPALESAIAKVTQALKAMGASRRAAPAKADMGRAEMTYADGGAVPAQQGIDVSEPVAGYYRFRLHSKAVRGGVRIWHGPPHDPVTGEEMDRSHRWQAEHDGEPIHFDLCWPQCAGEPITEAQYLDCVSRRRWAKEHAPESGYAEIGKRHDPLSLKSPLPF